MECIEKTIKNSADGGNIPTVEELYRIIMLKSALIWDNRLSKPLVEKWLSNFDGRIFDKQYEQRLALWLLANFVYYNEKEVRHLCKTLYREYVHQITLQIKSELSSSDLNSKLREKLMESRFYHLGKPGESGGFILYYFRQENGIPVSLFLEQPDKLPESVDTIVFVDDVTLSSEQADRYLTNPTFNQIPAKKILITLISTCEAESLLREKGIKVISCISLDKRSKCFENESSIFYHCKDHLINCKLLAETYGKELYSEHPLGHKNGQYAFGFFYNTPNNTLPIFWSNARGWTPVINRYSKVYGGEIKYDFGTFI